MAADERTYGSTDAQPTAATKRTVEAGELPVVGPTSTEGLVVARQVAVARYEQARRLLRQALSLSKTYLDDGAPISAYESLVRACDKVVEWKAAAGPAPWEEERCVGCGRTPSEGVGCSSCPGYNLQGYPEERGDVR